MTEHPLTKYAKLAGISVADIAREAACSRMTIYRVINGKQNPTVGLLERLSAATGGKVTVPEMITCRGIAAPSIDQEAAR